MSWEILDIFSVYNQTIIRNAKACKIQLLSLQHTRFNKKKKFCFSTYIKSKYDNQTFHKRNVQRISIYLNKHKIDYVIHNYLNSTKHKNFTLASQHTLCVKKKITFFYVHNTFFKRNVKMISIYLRKRNIDYVIEIELTVWSLQEWTIYFASLSIGEGNKFRFPMYITPEIWYSGVSWVKRANHFDLIALYYNWVL